VTIPLQKFAKNKAVVVSRDKSGFSLSHFRAVYWGMGSLRDPHQLHLCPTLRINQHGAHTWI